MVTHKHLAAALALGLACAAFTGAASAGGGNSGDAPGQTVKAETPAAAAKEAPATPPGQAKKAQNAPTTKSKATQARAKSKPAASKAKPSKGKSATAPGRTKTGTAAKPDASKRAVKAQDHGNAGGRSEEAHHHVIVCHRTGSDSNPYVVINIPMTAWNEAHKPGAGHPTLNGRDDILLGDAQRPGAKVLANGQAVDKSMCVTSVTGTQTTTTTTTTTTQTVAEQQTQQVAAQQQAGGVAGAQATLPQQAAEKAQPAGGVLGTIAEVGQTELPFTGLPLWIAALIGLALAGAGFGVRKATR